MLSLFVNKLDLLSFCPLVLFDAVVEDKNGKDYNDLQNSETQESSGIGIQMIFLFTLIWNLVLYGLLIFLS